VDGGVTKELGAEEVERNDLKGSIQDTSSASRGEEVSSRGKRNVKGAEEDRSVATSSFREFA